MARSTPLLKQVLFVSQARAEAMSVVAGYAIVSITDPGRPEARLQAGWQAIHRVAFHDIDPVDFPDEYDAMSAVRDEQALALARFVVESSSSCHTLVVHCLHGVSRSAGVAKAIAQTFRLAFPTDYDDANEFVYRAIHWALREATGEA